MSSTVRNRYHVNPGDYCMLKLDSGAPNGCIGELDAVGNVTQNLIRSTDVRCLMDDDKAFQEGIRGALEQYNTEQFITVKLPEQEHEVKQRAAFASNAKI
jgi:hypothetical protein